MRQISILGCGWLGLPLAKALIENGITVKGSTTSPEKLSMIEKLGIQPFLIALESGRISGDIETFLAKSKTLIIDIPPKLRGNSNDFSTVLKKTFVEKIKTLIPFIEKSTVENVLFISSTSVYGDTSSLDCARVDTLSVTEETKTCPETESGKQLIEAELLLQNNETFKTTVLRFGGLIGEDRNPVKFLAGRKNLENPNVPINLIHQVDCIGIILEILRTPEASGQNDKLVWNQTFNAVAPFHPTRKEYYTQKATELNLALPEFVEHNSSNRKIISISKVEEFLKYTFVKTRL